MRVVQQTGGNVVIKALLAAATIMLAVPVVAAEPVRGVTESEIESAPTPICPAWQRCGASTTPTPGGWCSTRSMQPAELTAAR